MTVDQIITALKKLRDVERLDVLHSFCEFCGCSVDDGGCQCSQIGDPMAEEE